MVLIGVFVVGLSSVIGANAEDDDDGGSGSGNGKDSKALLGNILIVASQLAVATHLVVQEKFVSGYNVPPLQAVGQEGIFGFGTIVTILAIMQLATGGSVVVYPARAGLECIRVPHMHRSVTASPSPSKSNLCAGPGCAVAAQMARSWRTVTMRWCR